MELQHGGGDPGARSRMEMVRVIGIATSRLWSFKVQGAFTGRGGRERAKVAAGMEEEVVAYIYVPETLETTGSQGE